MILGFHHPAIVVPNLQVAISFYCKALEFSIRNSDEWHACDPILDQITGLTNSAAKFCLLQHTNCYLELFEFKSNAEALQDESKNADHLGIRHLAFMVEDVQNALDKILSHGGIKMNSPAMVGGIITAVYCRDPFQNIIELRTDTQRLPWG